MLLHSNSNLDTDRLSRTIYVGGKLHAPSTSGFLLTGLTCYNTIVQFPLYLPITIQWKCMPGNKLNGLHMQDLPLHYSWQIYRRLYGQIVRCRELKRDCILYGDLKVIEMLGVIWEIDKHCIQVNRFWTRLQVLPLHIYRYNCGWDLGNSIGSIYKKTAVGMYEHPYSCHE